MGLRNGISRVKRFFLIHVNQICACVHAFCFKYILVRMKYVKHTCVVRVIMYFLSELGLHALLCMLCTPYFKKSRMVATKFI